MLKIRRATDRGHFNHGWLDTYHTFSFSDYQDPGHMRFRTLRVINEDTVMPAEGFDTHGHEDMEIITCVLEGALQHRDSLGNGSIIRPGDVQRMSAGTGITHSEFNASKSEPVHLLQIWIFPERKGLEPSYEQKYFSRELREGGLLKIASRGGTDGSVTLHQDATLFTAVLGRDQSMNYRNPPNRFVWIQMIRGDVNVAVTDGGTNLRAGDGASLSVPGEITFQSQVDSEFLLFDLA